MEEQRIESAVDAERSLGETKEGDQCWESRDGVRGPRASEAEYENPPRGDTEEADSTQRVHSGSVGDAHGFEKRDVERPAGQRAQRKQGGRADRAEGNV